MKNPKISIDLLPLLFEYRMLQSRIIETELSIEHEVSKLIVSNNISFLKKVRHMFSEIPRIHRCFCNKIYTIEDNKQKPRTKKRYEN